MNPTQYTTLYVRCGHTITTRIQPSSPDNTPGSHPWIPTKMIYVDTPGQDVCPNCQSPSDYYLPEDNVEKGRFLSRFRRSKRLRDFLSYKLIKNREKYRNSPDGNIRAEEATLVWLDDHHPDQEETKERFDRIRHLYGYLDYLCRQADAPETSLHPPLNQCELRTRRLLIRILLMKIPVVTRRGVPIIADWPIDEIEANITLRNLIWEQKGEVRPEFHQKTLKILAVLKAKCNGSFRYPYYEETVHKIQRNLNEIEQQQIDLFIQQEKEKEDRVKKLLTIIPVAELGNDETDRRCPVCQEDYGKVNGEQEGEEPARLPCGHVAGNVCMLRWMTENGSCLYRCKFPGSHEAEGSPDEDLDSNSSSVFDDSNSGSDFGSDSDGSLDYESEATLGGSEYDSDEEEDYF